MKTRILGRTNLQVSELALGGLFISSICGGFQQSRETILKALELGVNYIDTAPTYANSSDTLHLGSNDFSIAVWIRYEKPMRSVFGTLLNKFDPAQRCGFNFYIASSAPGYNAMSDQRFVHLGIDDGYVSDFQDCGKPWASNSGVLDLIVYHGQLYYGRDPYLSLGRQSGL